MLPAWLLKADRLSNSKIDNSEVVQSARFILVYKLESNIHEMQHAF